MNERTDNQMNQPAHTCEETLRRVLLLCRCTAEGTVPAEVREEAARTAAALAECGLEAEIRGMTPGWEENCWPDRETLCLCDSPAAAAELIGRGAAVAGWSHAGNRGEHFADVGYLLEEPDQVDRDSYEKIWQRERHLPWTILETERCLVREFVPGDLEAIRSLYDGEARRWLEAPSEHTERERDILRAYIRRGYDLYGYGHWAVILKETGQLIGRMGYAVPRHSRPGEENAAGITETDGILGYLIGAPWRRRGLTREVCRALIRYGREELGFDRIVAEVRPDNTASGRFLESLGFARVPCPLNARGECTYMLR